MSRIPTMIRKEFIQILRDPKTLRINILAPVFQLIILGYAASLDVREIPTVVCDLDNSKTSRDFVALFTNSGYFRLTALAKTPGDIDRSIDDGDATIALLIPRDFGNDLKGGRIPQLEVIADGAETNSATLGLSYATMIVTQYSRGIIVQTFRRMSGAGLVPGRVSPEIRVWYNPELRSRNFMIPGVVGLLLMVMTMLLTSLAVVREMEIGTMEQLIVTPIRAYELVAGKLAPFTIIGFIDVLLVVVVSSWWFGVPIRGNIGLLFLLCGVFLMTTLGTGLFISTVSKTQQQAMLTAVFFVIMPMMFLSGFVFPIENMPKVIQLLTYIIPLRYFFIIVRGLFLKGVGLGELWQPALILFSFGCVILAMSIFRFRKKLA